jgi:hypothetical protein
MTNPYRAMCAELLAALKSWSPHGGGPLECWEDREEEADLIARAETELAQPVAEGPTDEDLDAFIYGFFFEDDWYYNTEMERGLAHAVIAKWGHQ